MMIKAARLNPRIAPGKYCLKNVPALRDTYTMKRLLEMSGAAVLFENNIIMISETQISEDSSV